MKEILVTGGAGYVGSVTVEKLIKKGYRVSILDNLSTGHKKLVNPRASFHKIDLGNQAELENLLLKKQSFDAVIHFGSFSQVGESQKIPEKYYQNNIVGTLNLLRALKKTDCRKFIFSSSAAVYGNPKKIPISENSALKPLSVYGETKAIIENILELYEKTDDFRYVALRYFNAGGASESLKYGEIHNPETHLIPSIIKKILQNKTVEIFGDKYETPDGTCVRDFVHVEDLAEAHIKAIDYLTNKSSCSINLGSGKGYSVMEVLNECELTVGKKIKYKISKARPGDPAILRASISKAKNLLGWKPEKSLHDIIKSAWEFELKQQK